MGKFIRAIVYVTLIAVISTFAHAAENKPEDYNFGTDRLIVKDAAGEVIRTFTIPELQELFPQKIYDTEDPWSEGKKSLFRGPRVKDILENLAILKDKTIKVTAYDDYSTLLEYGKIQTYDPIFAIEMKCTEDDYQKNICQKNQIFRPIAFSDKGSIRLIWPFDQFPSGSLSVLSLLSSIWIYSITMIQVVQ